MMKPGSVGAGRHGGIRPRCLEASGGMIRIGRGGSSAKILGNWTHVAVGSQQPNKLTRHAPRSRYLGLTFLIARQAFLYYVVRTIEVPALLSLNGPQIIRE